MKNEKPQNEKLYNIRQILKLNQREMAEALDLSTANYNRLENGRIDMSGQTFYKLLKLLTKHNIIQIKKLKDY